MENLPKAKKSRLIADFTLDHTGGWGGGVSNKMRMIKVRVIKGGIKCILNVNKKNVQKGDNFCVFGV